jgi:hypothetical protein
MAKEGKLKRLSMFSSRERELARELQLLVVTICRCSVKRIANPNSVSGLYHLTVLVS